MAGPLIIPPESARLWRKMQKMEDEERISYPLLYKSFEAVDRYLISSKKDKCYWKTWLLKEYSLQSVERFSNASLYDCFGEEGPEMVRKIQLPVDISEIDDEELKLLEAIACGDTITYCHKAALQSTSLEILKFIEKENKHPFDFVMEDMKDDIPAFCILQLSFEVAIGTN